MRRRAAGAAGWRSRSRPTRVVVFLPLATGDWVGATMLPERVATVGIMWALAIVCLIHATRMRDVRRSLQRRGGRGRRRSPASTR